MPEEARPAYEGAGVHSLALGERAVLARLRTLEEEAFAALPGASEGLWRKLLRESRRQTGLEGLLTAVKSKRYTRSRLDRMVLCAFLGLTAEDLAAEAPYVRILGFRDRGRQALREMSSRLPWPTPARGWKAPILPWNSGAKDCTASLARRWKPRSCGSGWPACSLGGRPHVELSPICPLDILT
ncbi:MAG: nucleotidyltransferase family protein [Oscillospiraceae bacterium]